MKKNRGITLVALVVTIIVMLIIAATAISLITGQEGLFGKANEAKSQYNQKAQDEADRIHELLGYTVDIPKLTNGNVTFTASPDTNINPDIYGTGVMVTITENTNSGFQLQYSLDEGKTYQNYTGPIEVKKYGQTILTRLFDTSTQVEGKTTATFTVLNIDTLAPKEYELTATEGETTITVNGSTEDADATSTSAKSAIVKYEYKLNNGNWVTPDVPTSTSYTFTGLTAETNYTVSMRATDTAGNVREASNKNYSINTADIPTYTLTVANGTIDATGGTSGTYKRGTQVSITATVPQASTETTWSGQTAEVKGNIRYHTKHTYSFSSWSNVATTATTTVTVNGNTTVTANITDTTSQVDKQKYDDYGENVTTSTTVTPKTIKIVDEYRNKSYTLSMGQSVTDNNSGFKYYYNSSGYYHYDGEGSVMVKIYDNSNNKFIKRTSYNTFCDYTTSTTTWQSNWCWKDI